MKSKISHNKYHNINTNNQNDKILESAPSEVRYTTTSINKKNKKNSINKINNNNNYNHKNISKNDMTMTTLITKWQTTSVLIVGTKTATKITVITTRETVSTVMRATATVTTITTAVSKESGINSSNINSKININSSNNNSKENNINSNKGDNITTIKQKQTRKTAFIIGDSVVKKTGRYLLTSSVHPKYIMKVRPSLSSKTIYMIDYIKPTQRDFNPEVYLLHVRKNELSSDKSPEQMSLDVLNLVNSLRLDNNTVIASIMVPCDDENLKKQMRSILF